MKPMTLIKHLLSMFQAKPEDPGAWMDSDAAMAEALYVAGKARQKT